MKKTKLPAILLAAVMLAVCFAGCGKTEKAETTASTTAATETTAEAATETTTEAATETATEVPVLIKTTPARYAALEAAIRARHPYELPEIVAVPVMQGLPGYLDWVEFETTGDD